MILAAILWHVLTIGEITAEDPCDWRAMRTHVEVTGYRTYQAMQEDGDRHIRLCEDPKVKGMDRKRCIVLECIPALPCTLPPKGRRLVARGVTRYDAERAHEWWEIHPVIEIKEAR